MDLSSPTELTAARLKDIAHDLALAYHERATYYAWAREAEQEIASTRSSIEAAKSRLLVLTSEIAALEKEAAQLRRVPQIIVDLNPEA